MKPALPRSAAGRENKSTGFLLVVLDLFEVGIDDVVVGGLAGRGITIAGVTAAGSRRRAVDRLADLHGDLRQSIRRRLDLFGIFRRKRFPHVGDRGLNVALHG